MERIDILKANEHKFWKNVKKDIPEVCWLWMKYIDKDGYGVFQFCHSNIRHQYKAHRVSYELTNGSIPDGLIICHKCDNPQCINPNHLFIGTHKDNVDDKVSKNRQAKAEKNGRSKLNWEQVNSIRKECTNTTIQVLSKKYNISDCNIIDIIKNKSWINENYKCPIIIEGGGFKKGSIPQNRVLSNEIVLIIKSMINEGVKPKNISEKTGIKVQKIKDIKRGIAYYNIN